MRKLATIQQVSEVFPHPNADLLEIARIKGWYCVVKKGEFKPGDLGVYFEIDSFLPASDERYSFLSNKFISFEGITGARIRTIKLRGQMSQGLILPIHLFPEIKNYEIGQDVTELLGIIKFEKPLPLSEEAKGNFPSFIQSTDQERIQNISFFDPSGQWEVSEKLEGSSLTIYHYLDNFGVCSRNLELKESNKSSMWEIARKYNLKERLSQYGKNIALQGEIVGPKIQDNIYKLHTYKYYIFNIYDIENKRRLFPEERLLVIEELNKLNGLKLESVPIIEYIELPKNIDLNEYLLKMADGKSSLNPEVLREGLVFKNMNNNFSFKVISNAYLLNEK